MSAILLETNRRFGLQTSGLQFLFWLILLICGIPQLRTQIRNYRNEQTRTIDDKYDEYYFTSFIIFYTVSFVIWFLNCFADRSPLHTKYPQTDVMKNVFFLFLILM